MNEVWSFWRIWTSSNVVTVQDYDDGYQYIMKHVGYPRLKGDIVFTMHCCQIQDIFQQVLQEQRQLFLHG